MAGLPCKAGLSQSVTTLGGGGKKESSFQTLPFLSFEVLCDVVKAREGVPQWHAYSANSGHDLFLSYPWHVAVVHGPLCVAARRMSALVFRMKNSDQILVFSFSFLSPF